METITYIKAFDAADKIVARVGKGYSLGTDGCTYVRQDGAWNEYTREYEHGPLRSVCIVGKIFEFLGVPLSVMEGESVLHASRDNFAEFGVVMTDKAFYFLDTAQMFQDDGMPWGDAVEYADRITNRRKWSRSEESFMGL